VAGGKGLGVENATGDYDLEGGDAGWQGGGIDCEGGKEWEDGVFESGGELGGLVGSKVANLEWVDAGGDEGGDNVLGKESVLLGAHFKDALAECSEIADGGESGGVCGFTTVAAHEHEAANANLEEFVEIGGGDSEELDALEEWEVFAKGFVEDALIKLEP